MLATPGLAGDIVHTPGHSPVSVCLLRDDGSVFTGDVTPPMLVTDEQADEVVASWDRLRQRGAPALYAGHGPVRPMPA